MSNKETLQTYNERLDVNNLTLDSILDTINNLPEASGGESFVIEDCSALFKNGTRIDQFELLLPYINGTKNAQEMFSAIPSTVKPENFNDLLSQFDSSNVTNMANMFSNGTSAHGLPLSNLDTSNVTNMNSMFRTTSPVDGVTMSSFDFSNFNTENVTDMGNMFAYFYASGELDISNFSSKTTVDMTEMFYYAQYITNLKLGPLKPSRLYSTFNSMGTHTGSTGLTLDISKLDTSECTSLYQTFHSNNLSSLDIRNFDTSNVTTMQGTFDGGNKLTTISISDKFVTNNVTTMQIMFRDCYVLESFDFSNFNTEKVTSTQYMFQNCRAFKVLDLSSFKTPVVKNMYGMFQNCYLLEELDISNFDFTNTTNFTNMFNNCGTQTSDGLTKVYVKDETAQNWILTKSNGRPSAWSAANVIIAGSDADLRGSE